MVARGFGIALEKFYVHNLTRKRIPILRPKSFVELVLKFKTTVKYLSLMLEDKLLQANQSSSGQGCSMSFGLYLSEDVFMDTTQSVPRENKSLTRMCTISG